MAGCSRARARLESPRKIFAAIMQIIPVIDLQHGQAVHAVAGDRNHYQPIQLPGTRAGDPLALASFYASRKPAAIYLADLDAIANKPAQLDLWLTLDEIALCLLWIDCGVRHFKSSAPFMNLCQRSSAAHCLVVGSETLQQVTDLEELARQITSDQLLISLDRRGGRSIASGGAVDEFALLRHAERLGIRRVIALDLAGVGTGRAHELLPSWRDLLQAFPSFEWILAGGIASHADLSLAQQAGFRAVLAATAVLKGIL